jgi:hypothetical protein
MNDPHRALRRAALAALVISTPLGAQVRISERGSVSQVLDGTTISVDYARPVARGRDSLFGKVVHWGDTWTPGANWATTLEADRDVRLNGQPLAKGKYSLWVIPRERGEWSVFLSREARHFHVPAPDTSQMVLRFTATPEQRPAAEEVLTWSFPTVAPDAATLRMQWGTTALPIRVTTQPTRVAVVPADERALYVGRYAMRTTNANPPAMQIADEAGTLRVRPDRKVYGMYDYYDLIPDGPQRFKRALYANGQLAEVEAELTFVFDVAGGRATGFRVLGPNDHELARADRVSSAAPSRTP